MNPNIDAGLRGNLKADRGFGLEWAFCFFFALTLILLASTSSPLYAFNDWVDANSFMTMGRGIQSGLVPYRDLFEQKGPLLYFLHAAASMLDQDGFFGVFLLEVISLTVALRLGWKLVGLVVPVFWNLLILPLFGTLYVASPAFEGGDSAEEFCLPLIMGLFVIMAVYLRRKEQAVLPVRLAFVAGLLGGCVFLIKYTLLGFWIGFLLIMVLDRFWFKNDNHLLRTLLAMFAGFAVAVIPILLYFGINHALVDFIDVYLLVNMRLYIPEETLLRRLYLAGESIGSGIINNILPGLLIIFGLFRSVKDRRLFLSSAGMLMMPLAGLIQILAIYAGGRGHTYYFLGLFPLMIIGLIALALLSEDRPAIRCRLESRPAIIRFGAIWLAAVTLTLVMGPNSHLIGQKRADYPQFAFAEIIRQVPDATLLNYGFLDGGFYTAAKIVPTSRYFMRNNIAASQLPEMYSEQDRFIEEGAVTFVVLRMNVEDDPRLADPPALRENYTLVAEMTRYYRSDKNLVFKYALFRLRDSETDSKKS